MAIIAVEPHQSLNMDEHYNKAIAILWLIIIHIQCPRIILAQATPAFLFD